MKSRNERGFANSVDLRIHLPANLMIMFSFSGCDVFFPCGLSHVLGVFCGWGLK